MATTYSTTAEAVRLAEDAARTKNWKRWGPYLAERQWATVREEYSPDGTCWDDFPHEHARSRAYRWGEDGLLGITDRQCRLCFALALWNERDPILKERLFGLTGPEGNHGEDVKEAYFYLDATPTHAYMKALYKYPQAEFPYGRLVDENRRRGSSAPEFELDDSGIFSGNRYFDVIAEYAKAAPDDVLIRISVQNQDPEPAALHLLPTVWFRNTWSWGCKNEGCFTKPNIRRPKKDVLAMSHETLGDFTLRIGSDPQGNLPALLFTENETNYQRLYGVPNKTPYVKDAFHSYLIKQHAGAVNPQLSGTNAALHYVLRLKPGEMQQVRLRLTAANDNDAVSMGSGFDQLFSQRIRESDEFHAAVLPDRLTAEARKVARQAYAGLLWTKQFYHYIIREWLDGDPDMPAPPENRRHGRNQEWTHLYSRDILSVPDKWEYPWFAAWDLAFHMLPVSRIDPQFAKEQLILLLREWYMHPNGQIPAYEFAFADVNPPVHGECKDKPKAATNVVTGWLKPICKSLPKNGLSLQSHRFGTMRSKPRGMNMMSTNNRKNIAGKAVLIACVVMGLTRMRLLTFFRVSQIGMLPGTIVYVNVGRQPAGIDSLSGVLSPGVLISFAVPGIFRRPLKNCWHFTKKIQ